MPKKLRLTAVAIVLVTARASPALADNYGSIAYSPQSGASGWSYDHSTRRSAEAKALRNCKQHAADCEIVVWFVNSCGAVAVGVDNSRLYAGTWAGSRAAAERAALAACAKLGSACRIDTWTCSSTGSGSNPPPPAVQAPPPYNQPSPPAYSPPVYSCPPGRLLNGHQCY